MEERIIDKDDERLIRLKKKGDEVDAEDALTEEDEESEEEVVLTLPEDDEDYDEDLVGLTPTELKREQARRKKAEEEARAECYKLVEEGEAVLARGEYEKAESLFSQANCYGFADERIVGGLWTARTKNFTDTAPFYDEANAEEFADSDAASKKFVREKVAKVLLADKEKIEKEEQELAPVVLEKQEERRQAFAENRKYYALRLLIFLGIFAAFAIAAAVSAGYIVRTMSNVPVILTGVFGGLTVVSFVVDLIFFLKFLGASKLCRMNEKLPSTEDGMRLCELRGKLVCLEMILEDEEE